MISPTQPSAELLQTDAAIRDLEQAYDAAWQAHDLDALLACFLPEALIVNPYGEAAEGHEQILLELARVLDDPASPGTHVSDITRVVLLTDEVALVDGEARLKGRGEAAFSHRFTDVLVRRGSRWFVAQTRAYQHVERPR
jgi:uncharacterized protein (TIGR02246 family)